MKSAVVFYSMSGNCRLTAEKIAEKLGSHIIEIKPVESYPDKGMKKFLWGGKAAVMAETPKLQKYEFKGDMYDLIIIGFPVWAGTITPPIRTFIYENSKILKEKKTAVFACLSGLNGDKAIEKFKGVLNSDKLIASVSLTDPKDRPSEENERKLAAFLEKLCNG